MIPRLDISLSATSLSCYTHDKNGITLYPANFYNDVSLVARDLSIDYAVWDHGDGTFSKSLTSTHRYANPGTYNATLFVYDEEGQQYRSEKSLTIEARNYISDTLTWVNHGAVFNIPASTKKWYPFKVQMFKSWQTWPSVSATGYSLNLNVSGSKSEKLNINDYYNDKWSHLRNIWTFHRPITSGMEEILLPIDRYDLKDDTVKLYLSSYKDTAGDDQTMLTNVSGKDVEFVGTSAEAVFYYYDETPANFTGKDAPLICFASLDTKNFNPEYNTGNGQPPVTLDLAQSKSIIMPVRVRSSYSEKISINSIGLPSFSLPKVVYENSKVPFFACFADSDNNAKENNYPPLTATTDTVYNRTSDFYKIRLSVLDSEGKSVSADFFSGGWDDTLPKEIPNYCRGYFIPREAVESGRVHAEGYLIDKLTASREYFHSYFVSPPLSSVFIVSRPDRRLKYEWPESIGQVKIDIVDSKDTDMGAHEVYPMCVTPDQSVIGTTFDRSFVYVGDGRSRNIYKLDHKGRRLAKFDAIKNAIAKNFPPRINNRPASYTDVDPVVSRITSDKDSNIWVSLFDSISSFKLNGSTGEIMETIADIDFNKYFQRGSTYYSYSDTDTSTFHISDIGKPTCIETDINGGPWIGYDTLSGSHISNYDSKGKFATKLHLDSGQFVYDMLVNNRDALWVSTYYDRTSRPTIKNITDHIDDFVVYREDDLDYSTLKFKFICKDATPLNDLIAREENIVIDVVDTPDYKLNMQYLTHSRGEQYGMSDDPDAATNATLSAHYATYSDQTRNVVTYKVKCHQSVYWHHVPDLQSYPVSANPDMLIRAKKSDEIYRISGKGSTIQKRGGFLYPTYLTLDLNNNLWVTHSNNILSNIIDDPTNLAGTYIFDQYIGETTSAVTSSYNTNLQFQNHDALTCTLNNDIYVLDNFHRKMYVVNADNRTVVTTADILNAQDNADYEKQIRQQPDYVEGEMFSFYYQAIGDWNGIRYFHKFENNAISVKRLTGEHTLSVAPASGKYHAFKINENFNPEGTLKSYRTQTNIVDSDKLFETFLGQALGNEKSLPTALGKKMYETTANFASNHVSTDTCNIQAINSMAKMGDVQIDNQNKYVFPGSLKRVMDIGSIRKDTLWGKRDNFVRNFTDIQDLPRNIGKQLDVNTYMVTPGTPIVAHELYSNQYLLVVPHFLEHDFNVDLKNNKIEEYQYPLSSFNTIGGEAKSWNWSIMDSVSGADIANFYHFYEFKSTPSNVQANGIIDWSNTNNTVSEKGTTYKDWVQDSGVLDQMIEYELRSNLDLFSTTPYTQKVEPPTRYAVTDIATKSTEGTSNIETIEFLQQQQTSYIPASGTVDTRSTSTGITITEELQGEASQASDESSSSSSSSSSNSGGSGY